MKQFVDENNYPLFDGLVGLKQNPMQTAMQKLLEILESKILPCDDDNSYVYGMNVAHANLIYNIKNGFLEKEKEQIIDFAYGCVQHISREDIEEYYNQTYKQNK